MNGYPSVTITVNYGGGSIEVTEKATSYTTPLGEGRIASALLVRAFRRAIGTFGPEVAEAAKAVLELTTALYLDDPPVAAASIPTLERPDTEGGVER